MPKLRIYLDTSVVSHLFHEDAPERKADTEEFFENAILPKAYETFISSVVLEELARTKNLVLRQRFLQATEHYQLDILPEGGNEVARLAALYMDRGVIPFRNPEDALHVAYATLFEMDSLVTWNFRHLARAKTAGLIGSINLVEGYMRPLRLQTPLELLQP